MLGIDLGGTKILGAVVDCDNRILGRAKRTTPAKEGGPAILQAMIACVDEAVQGAGLTRQEIAAAGIGSPGPLDTKSGVILFSSNLNVKNYPIGPELSAALDRPVLVQNDVRVGGYAEFRLGAGRGYRDIIAAFVGTGIGGCVIQGGEMVTGSTGNAGEIGHITIKAGGPRCGAAPGLLEALASKTAIGRRVQKAVRKGLPTVLGDKMARKGGRLKSGDLAEAVAAKDMSHSRKSTAPRTTSAWDSAASSMSSARRSSSSAAESPGRSARPTSTWSGPRHDPRPSPIPGASSESNQPPWATTPAFSATALLAREKFVHP